MAKTSTAPKPANETETDELIPSSTELPASVHQKITRAAFKHERSFAAQLRLIAKEWAAKQSTS